MSACRHDEYDDTRHDYCPACGEYIEDSRLELRIEELERLIVGFRLAEAMALDGSAESKEALRLMRARLVNEGRSIVQGDAKWCSEEAQRACLWTP